VIGEDSPRSDGERSEPERSGESSPIAAAVPAPSRRPSAVPDPEVSAKARRRQFSAKYKLRILQEADQCAPGELGALLRRKGLYWSNLQTWRLQRETGTLEGLAPKQRGRKPAPANPLARQVKELEKENRSLKRRLQRVEILLDIQKKASELLGIPLSRLDNDEND